MHGDLGLPAPRRVAQEPEIAQDQRMDHTMVVVIALDPHLSLLRAIQIAVQVN